MKALEILKHINRRYCTDSVNGKLDLAIKELEDLENRSCESCKLYNFIKCPCWIHSDIKPKVKYCSELELK